MPSACRTVPSSPATAARTARRCRGDIGAGGRDQRQPRGRVGQHQHPEPGGLRPEPPGIAPAHEVDRREVRRCPPATIRTDSACAPAHDDLAGEPAAPRQRRRVMQDRSPARLRIGAVDRQPRAAEVRQRRPRVACAHDNRAPVPARRAAGHRVVERAHHRDPPRELAHQRQPAGLPEDQPRIGPAVHQRKVAAQRLRRRDAFGPQGIAQRRPQAVGGAGELRPVVHRQGGERRRHCRSGRPETGCRPRRPARAGSRSGAPPDPCAAGSGA